MIHSTEEIKEERNFLLSQVNDLNVENSKLKEEIRSIQNKGKRILDIMNSKFTAKQRKEMIEDIIYSFAFKDIS